MQTFSENLAYWHNINNNNNNIASETTSTKNVKF